MVPKDLTGEAEIPEMFLSVAPVRSSGVLGGGCIMGVATELCCKMATAVSVGFEKLLLMGAERLNTEKV